MYYFRLANQAPVHLKMLRQLWIIIIIATIWISKKKLNKEQYTTIFFKTIVYLKRLWSLWFYLITINKHISIKYSHNMIIVIMLL